MPKFRAEPDPFDLLDRGSREHYDDPAYYDQAYRRRRDDVASTAAWRDVPAARSSSSASAAAASRSLCRDGHAVVGVDARARCRTRARARSPPTSRGAGSRRCARATCAVRLRRRFPLVIAPFNALMHLYEPQDVVKCFANVARHLAPDGRFVFDVRMRR